MYARSKSKLNFNIHHLSRCRALHHAIKKNSSVFPLDFITQVLSSRLALINASSVYPEYFLCMWRTSWCNMYKLSLVYNSSTFNFTPWRALHRFWFSLIASNKILCWIISPRAPLKLSHGNNSFSLLLNVIKFALDSIIFSSERENSPKVGNRKKMCFTTPHSLAGCNQLARQLLTFPH